MSNDDIRSMEDVTAPAWIDPRPLRYAEAAARDRAGDHAAAAAIYRRLAAIWPAYRPQIRYNLASLLARQGRDRRATTVFLGIADDVDAAPALRAGAHFHLGRLADVRGLNRAARDHLRSALVIAPDHAAARALLDRPAEAAGPDVPAPLPRPLRRARPARWAPCPTLVYQMGKVGSTSVAAGLHACLPGVDVWHSHLLDPGTFARYEGWFARDPALPPLLVRSTRAQIATSRTLRARLLGDGPRWRVLTIAREPVSHLVSMLFHHLEVYQRLSGAHDAPPSERLERLHAYAVDTIERWAARPGLRDEDPARAVLTLAARWFDEELEAVLGADVYARPFDVDRGYVLHRTRRADIAVVRFENLSWAAADAVRALSGAKDFILPRQNRAQDRPSGGLYADYLRLAAFPRDLVDAIYATPYARHFYRDAERRLLARRWSGA